MEQSVVKHLIASWEPIHDALNPSYSSYISDEQQRQDFTILSVFSGRQEYWEFIVGSVGYLSDIG